MTSTAGGSTAGVDSTSNIAVSLLSVLFVGGGGGGVLTSDPRGDACSNSAAVGSSEPLINVSSNGVGICGGEALEDGSTALSTTWIASISASAPGRDEEVLWWKASGPFSSSFGSSGSFSKSVICTQILRQADGGTSRVHPLVSVYLL